MTGLMILGSTGARGGRDSEGAIGGDKGVCFGKIGVGLRKFGGDS